MFRFRSLVKSRSDWTPRRFNSSSSVPIFSRQRTYDILRRLKPSSRLSYFKIFKQGVSALASVLGLGLLLTNKYDMNKLQSSFSAQEIRNERIEFNFSEIRSNISEIRADLAILKARDHKTDESFEWIKAFMQLSDLRYKELKQEVVTVKSDIGVIKKQMELSAGR